jgi:hypothetical protein
MIVCIELAYLLHLEGGSTDDLSWITEIEVRGGLTVGHLLVVSCMHVCIYMYV